MHEKKKANIINVSKTEEELKQKLTPLQYAVTRQKGTEPAFTGKYWKTKTPGIYKCVVCGQELFDSDTKFDSGTGWPSFYAPIIEDNIENNPDSSHGMQRVEVVCSSCGSHLGHLFPDGPEPGGLRYCLNSASLDLSEEK